MADGCTFCLACNVLSWRPYVRNHWKGFLREPKNTRYPSFWILISSVATVNVTCACIQNFRFPLPKASSAVSYVALKTTSTWLLQRGSSSTVPRRRPHRHHGESADTWGPCGSTAWKDASIRVRSTFSDFFETSHVASASCYRL